MARSLAEEARLLVAPSDMENETSVSPPGFGIPGTLAGFAGGAWLLGQLRDRNANHDKSQ